MTMTTHNKHIAPEAYFLDYVAGTLNPSDNLVIETHIDLNDQARRVAHDYFAIGGALLDSTQCAQESLSQSCLDSLLNRLDHDEEDADEATTIANSDILCPQPLKAFIDKDFDKLEWVKLMNGVYHFPLETGCQISKARLMMIEPGRAVPEHAHDGPELTLVLRGAFQDQGDIYNSGDLAAIMDHEPHTPAAYGDEVCFCLASNTKGVRLTGLIGRLLNPFIKF